MTSEATNRAVEATFRIERARLIGSLTRQLRDVGLAEELAQDALVAAIQHWPHTGVPRNPGAWLMQTAKRRAIDHFRRNAMAGRKLDELGRELRDEEQRTPDLGAAADDPIGDDLLGLIFIACHPILKREARVAMTLRLVGGLTTAEIARAFLTTEATVAQRIVRAKRSLSASGTLYEIPDGTERQARLGSVLEVIYLIFSEGYSATAGQDWTRPALCEEAMRLGRVLARLAPDVTDVHALLALMELQASRLGARTTSDGTVVPLLEQNRVKWDHLMIRRGLASLRIAQAAGGGDSDYALQAAVAACHARAARPEQTDWFEIAALYDKLWAKRDNPIVELNRAVAHGMAEGPQTGLELLDALGTPPELARYYLLPAARGEMLMRAGKLIEAAAAFELAATLAGNLAERRHLLSKAATCKAVRSA